MDIEWDYIELETTPYSEDCAKVGQDDYTERSKLESRVFIKQLLRQFPIPEILEREIKYKVKLNFHDFGDYREVRVYYNSNNGEAWDYASYVEDNIPENWDEEALAELKEKGY